MFQKLIIAGEGACIGACITLSHSHPTVVRGKSSDVNQANPTTEVAQVPICHPFSSLLLYHNIGLDWSILITIMRQTKGRSCCFACGQLNNRPAKCFGILQQSILHFNQVCYLTGLKKAEILDSEVMRLKEKFSLFHLEITAADDSDKGIVPVLIADSIPNQIHHNRFCAV